MKETQKKALHEKIIETILEEILYEEDHEKRFQLIQQLELFTRALQGLDDIRE